MGNPMVNEAEPLGAAYWVVPWAPLSQAVISCKGCAVVFMRASGRVNKYY